MLRSRLPGPRMAYGKGRGRIDSGSGGHRNRTWLSSWALCSLSRRVQHFADWSHLLRYWQTLLWLFIILTALELALAPFRGLYASYSVMLGYIGLSVEATLPLPQIFSNARSRSCKGFRFSVLASWLAGDAMKMFWFFTSTTEIPWAFKMCGIFQAFCDMFLGVQYMMYGSGEGKLKVDESAPVWNGEMKSLPVPGGLPSGRRTPFEKPLQ